jgi:hypothetical protein
MVIAGLAPLKPQKTSSSGWFLQAVARTPEAITHQSPLRAKNGHRDVRRTYPTAEIGVRE